MNGADFLAYVTKAIELRQAQMAFEKQRIHCFDSQLDQKEFEIACELSQRKNDLEKAFDEQSSALMFDLY
jgi:hypothetical protein